MDHGASKDHGANDHGAKDHGANEHVANDHGANHHGVRDHTTCAQRRKGYYRAAAKVRSSKHSLNPWPNMKPHDLYIYIYTYIVPSFWGGGTCACVPPFVVQFFLLPEQEK